MEINVMKVTQQNISELMFLAYVLKLAQWNKALLEMMTVTELVKKFPTSSISVTEPVLSEFITIYILTPLYLKIAIIF